MPPSTQVVLKKTYKASGKIENFFTGGRPALSKNGHFLVCPCGEEVKMLDLRSTSVYKTFPGDTELITAVAVSPDGASVFSSSRSLQTKWWDTETLECKRSWKAHDGPVAALTTDASGGLLASGSADRGLRVWDVALGRATHNFRGHTGIVAVLKFHPDHERLQLFSGGADAAVFMWDLVRGTLLAKFNAHFSAVTDLAFSGDGNTLLSASRDKMVYLWGIGGLKPHREALEPKPKGSLPVYESLEGIVVLPEGSPFPGSLPEGAGPEEAVRFLTVGEQGRVRAWRSDRGTPLFEQKDSEAAPQPREGGGGEGEESIGGFLSASLVSNGALPPRHLMCISADQRVLLYAPTMRLEQQVVGQLDEVVDLRWVGAGEECLAVATNSEQVGVYSVGQMATTRTLRGHTDTVLCLEVGSTSEGRVVLASAGKDQSVRLWDPLSGECLAVARGHMGAVSAVGLGRKGCSFMLSGSSDRTIKLWSLEGVFAATGDAAKGVLPVQLTSRGVVVAHDKDINSIAVAPNDSLLCSGSQDKSAKVWKLPHLALVWTLRGHKRGVWCVDFSPVDQVVLTSSADGTLRIWSLTDGSCLKHLEGHTGSVLKAAFVTRGLQIMSAGADGLLKLWTSRSGECVNTFEGHEDKIWALAVSGGSETVATGGGDSLVQLWKDCTLEEEEEAAVAAEEEVEKEQEMNNALTHADYVEALRLAFQLKRPFKMLSVFAHMSQSSEAGDQLQRVVGSMEGEQLQRLVEYIREWNTNSKHCHTAQRVLTAILKCHPPSALVQVPGIRQVVEGLVPYTERHLARIQRLVRSTFLLDYTLAAMVVLPPGEGLEEEGEAAGVGGGEKEEEGKKKRKKKAGGVNGRVNGSGGGEEVVEAEGGVRDGGDGGEEELVRDVGKEEVGVGEVAVGDKGGAVEENGEGEGGGGEEAVGKKKKKKRKQTSVEHGVGEEGVVGVGGEDEGREQNLKLLEELEGALEDHRGRVKKSCKDKKIEEEQRNDASGSEHTPDVEHKVDRNGVGKKKKKKNG